MGIRIAVPPSGMEARVVTEIVFPRRPFRDVHKLVFLFQSWHLLVETELPPALQPLREIPEEFIPVMTRMLREARDQLESSQDAAEIALRFPASPEIEALMGWAAVKLEEVGALIQDPDLDPTWAGALGMAKEYVAAALGQLSLDPQV